MIVVKGMTMPKNCPTCPLSYWANHWTFLGCNIGGHRYAMKDKEYRESTTRPKWCPLVEIADMRGEKKEYRTQKEWEELTIEGLERAYADMRGED